MRLQLKGLRCKMVARRRRFMGAVLACICLVWIAGLLSQSELRDLPSLLWPGSPDFSADTVGNFSSPNGKVCRPNAVCIGFATKAFSSYSYWQFALQQHRVPGCSADCQLVSDPTQAHGLLFHGFDLPSRRRLRHLRSLWPPGQLWIYYSMESPQHLVTSRCVRDCDFALPLVGDALALAKEFVFPSYLLRSDPDTTEEAGFFNWTVTYRRDSTVYTPYARIGILPRTANSSWAVNVPPKVSTAIKKHLSFIVVSNCHPYNRREEVLRQLSSHMEVHIYGACGDRHLPRSVKVEDVSKSYYFYLTFENAFCRDYITEKFFSNGLNGRAVPVVFGGHSRQDVEAIAPPNSFLYAGDFESAAALAKRLKHLADHPVEYAEYHRWRQSYALIDANANAQYNMFCQLCQKLKATIGSAKSYRAPPLDLNQFYSSGTQCRPADFDPFGGGK